MSVGIGYIIVSGRAVSCNCFGQRSTDPIDKTSLVRSASLLGFAGVSATSRPLGYNSLTTGDIILSTGLAIVVSMAIIWLHPVLRLLTSSGRQAIP